MSRSALCNQNNAPRLIALILSLISLLLLVALATVLRTASKNTYNVSFGAPAWTGLYMIGPSLTILHSTGILVFHVVGRGTLNSGVDMALDFFGAAANVVPAAFLALQASFAGEILGSCDEPGDSEEWCREARTILGLEAAALFLILVVGLMHLMTCLGTCSRICNRRTSPDRTQRPLHSMAYEIEHHAYKTADNRPHSV